MHKLSILLAAIQITTAAITSLAQWQTYQTPSASAFFGVCVVNPEIIWACGSSGTVVRTTNSGSNWSIVNSGLPEIQYLHISAIDENTAWISGGTQGAKLYKTTNGGLNWIEQFYTQPYWINNLHFFDANTGIFLRDPPGGNFDTCGFFITRNGGTNWLYSPNSPITTILTDNCMGVLDTNFVWFCDNDKLYKLTGGLNGTWQSYLINGFAFTSQTEFINTNTGFATNSIKLLKTIDGGNNWNEIFNNLGSGSLSLTSVPGSNMLIATSNLSLRMSYTLGNTWEPLITYQYSDSIYMWYADAADSNSIWVAVNKGRLYKYNFAYIGINQLGTEVPGGFDLYQNYPNPFNPSTKIRFDLPAAGDVRFIVYDLLGRSVFELNEYKAQGFYEINFDGSALASGVYYYRIESGKYNETRKMILLK
jgi:photosystem II stability/assembly factor-like uncharacterized protein